MSDDEIEFLDEDADIVQQCVQAVHYSQLLEPKKELLEDEEPPPHVIAKPRAGQLPELRIERTSAVSTSSKKRKKEEEDLDYDPYDDMPYRKRKRRIQPHRQATAIKYETSSRSNQYSHSSPLHVSDRKASQPVKKVVPVPQPAIDRRKMTITLPDYEDPLCLPVRALVKDAMESRRLRQWNQLCLEQFRKNEMALRLSSGPILSSKRTIVIRNMFNKFSGKMETTFWNQVSIRGKEGPPKAEVAQAALPRYREKKVLSAFQLSEIRQKKFLQRSEVILAKEKYGDDETLVAYNPDQSLVMVFKMFEREGSEHPEEDKRYLQEVASCLSCARCYHTSWRGNESDNTRPAVRARCGVCSRDTASAAVLLAHVKTHSPEQRARARKSLAGALAKLLPYQYQCRLCQRRFPATRELRRHLDTHKGLRRRFYCEVGEHSVF